jgi:hypothetical protein
MMAPELEVLNRPAKSPATPSGEDAHGADDARLQSKAMQHIQHLSLSWLRKPTARVAEPKAPPLELPDRERIQRLARLYHRQLASAKQDNRVYYELLHQQTEALRQFTLELTPEQADAFMNMYTEESSAVEREWQAKRGKWRANEPLPPTLVGVLTFAVTVCAIALAIYYAI